MQWSSGAVTYVQPPAAGAALESSVLHLCKHLIFLEDLKDHPEQTDVYTLKCIQSRCFTRVVFFPYSASDCSVPFSGTLCILFSQSTTSRLLPLTSTKEHPLWSSFRSSACQFQPHLVHNHQLPSFLYIYGVSSGHVSAVPSVSSFLLLSILVTTKEVAGQH